MKVEGAPHGTTYGYTTWACRCVDCLAAHRAQIAKWQASNREQRAEVGGRMVSMRPNCPHGQNSGYTCYSCRCLPCTEARRLADTSYRARASGAT